MLDSTIELIRAGLKTDVTLNAADRIRLVALLRNGGAQSQSLPPAKDTPRIYSREQAAQLLGDRTPRYVDQLCKRGLLKKFTPPGNRRSIGIHSESLLAFIAERIA
jgi:hypothetical protein